ncbi:odontogenesis associated phosphoprotein [Dipodomys spectabilis]|uniref:odontogenesis associated phosphoprotein n=1 Tax=Dipodomys spectabilis TaxID=105255 RepID=UPI001C538AC6|nr:odontogenesis associated phosphoprotein [Dipodomys spectabilis]
MAHTLHSSRLLICWLVLTVAEGKDLVTRARGSGNNANPTDCQIFTLTPPPTTRRPVTRVQAATTQNTVQRLPQGKPRVPPRFPGGPFFPPTCNHRFHFQPFYWPLGRLFPNRYFLGRQLQSGSSSEESRD